MITSKGWCLVGLVSLVPALAIAQAPSSSKKLFQDRQKMPTFTIAWTQQQSSNVQKMSEDIEIMRRVLNRKLGLWPGLISFSLNNACATCHTPLPESSPLVRVPLGDGTFTDVMKEQYVQCVAEQDLQRWLDVSAVNDHHVFDAHASLGAPTNIEGVYLKGQGVVYTLTLPPPPQPRSSATKKTPSKPLTDWERALQSVRGDQPPAKEPEPVKEVKESGIFAELEKSGHLGLTEAILKVLAENGHHLSQMAPDEKITVAITFRQPAGATSNQAQTGIQPANPLNAWGNQPATSTNWEANGNLVQNFQPDWGATQQPGAGSGGGGAPPHVEASLRDHELLGDTLLKQGKAQEAIKAFQRALNFSPAPKHAASLYRKIAQADLMMADDAAAKKALEMAAEHLKEGADNTQKPGAAAKGATTSSLPAKLIISAPKRLLDQVAAGKIPYADFRQQAIIDYFGFSAKSTD